MVRPAPIKNTGDETIVAKNPRPNALAGVAVSSALIQPGRGLGSWRTRHLRMASSSNAMPSGMTAHGNQWGVDSIVEINTEIRTNISVKNAIPQHHPTTYPMEDWRGRGPSN